MTDYEVEHPPFSDSDGDDELGGDEAFKFSVQGEELFHITYDGHFVFVEGTDPDESARRFARYFNEEIGRIESTTTVNGEP